MALRPVTLRLDEEEYEKFKKHLNKLGDLDLNISYVIRAYIRDLNRAMPNLKKSDWDPKKFFGFLGIWLEQITRIIDVEMLAKGIRSKMYIADQERES